MRYLCLIILPFACCLGYAQDPPVESLEIPSQSLSLDAQIKILKQDIDKYQGYALEYNSRADRMEGIDFENYRRAILRGQECQGIIDQLKKYLNDLEQEKKLSKSESIPQK